MSNDEPHCSYIMRPDGIHQFTFNKASTQALDEFLSQLSTIYREAPRQTTTRVLVDLRPSGLPPMRQAASRGALFRSNVQEMPPARVAYVYRDSTLMSLAKTFLEIVRLKNVTRQFFHDDEAAAVMWLMAG